MSNFATGSPVRTLFGFRILLFLLFCFSALGQNVDRIAKAEVARRRADLPRGVAAAARGQAAMQSGNYRVAHEEFRAALNCLPDAVTSAKAHDEALTGFCDSGVKLAEQDIASGNYPEAESTVREVLQDRYDPNCRPAMELLAHLQEPGYFNRTAGPKFIEKIEEVKKLLADGQGYYDSGRYGLAFKKYEQVLAIDPYNTAARRGEEKIDNAKFKYSESAYDEARARANWQVEKGWEQPVKSYEKSVEPFVESFQHNVTGTARITQKLNAIVIPRVEFRDASVREAIDFLRQQAAANDPNPDEKKGVDIVLRLAPLGQIAPPSVPVDQVQGNGGAGAPATSPEAAPPGAPTKPTVAKPIVASAPVSSPAISPSDARITITLNQIPLGEALRYIASQAGLKVKVEPYAVSIIPISEQSNDLITKEYRVPPGFISTSVNIGPSALSQAAYKTGATTAAPGVTGTGKDTEESTGGHQLVNREGAKEFLESQGVQFPTGASAHFLPQSSRLIVRNTADNLELVDAIVEQASAAGPKQVEIEAKFVEINQNNLKEIGFDWLLGQFNVGNHKLFAGGGTSGTGVPVNPADWPFVPAGSQVPVGQFPVTAGNRSGQFAISANAIDALLFPSMGTSSLAPGIFGLSGVFTDPQFQVVIRALNQKKGIDLLSAPKITTKSGQRAVIEIVREFRYPTQFTEPKVPDIQSHGTTSSTTTTVALPVVGPSTPSNFETRNTGVTLEVEPVVGPDGVTIDLNLVPQVVEFEGFINYGSPIKTVNPALLGFSPSSLLGLSTSSITLTDNVINQPIFSTRKVTTNVSVWDGQTVVLGGLMREDVQKVEDRTPLLGDIPMVGRLFRSNVDQHIKRNLIIFVTARLVNPAGQPVNQAEEEEEMVEPPILQQIPAYKK
ncbi:MAG TPA: Amuc_1098 family type IV pilus outer membrane protein [Chthoniobacterales bacterium]|nr:Amuc_1098 family type IV pilus outer membrane protein [Chthoniobacterales bacterium]